MEGVSDLLLEKMKEAEGAMRGLMERILELLKEMLPSYSSSEGVLESRKVSILEGEQTKRVLKGLKESILEPLGKKLHQLLQFSLEKTKEAEEVLKSPKESIAELLQEKLPWVPQLWEVYAGFLVGKLEKVLPPVASSETLRIWVQLGMAVVLLCLSLFFLRCYLSVCVLVSRASTFCICACVRGACNTIRASTFCIRACVRGACKMMKASTRFLYARARGTGKIMKAPGRKDLLIPRASFESDPGGYFRNLRANGPWDGHRGRPSKKVLLGLAVLVAVVLIKAW